MSQKQLGNDYQLVVNIVKVKEAQRSRFIKSNLEQCIRQKPNKKFLGLVRLNVGLFRIGSSSPNQPIRRFIRYRLGEFPVILDSSQILSSIKTMQSLLKQSGFYYSSISYTVKTHKTFGLISLNKRMNVEYNVQLNKPYNIYRIDPEIADKELYYIYTNEMRENPLFKNGNELKRELLLKEQNRLFELFKNHGYYNFSKENIFYTIDTSAGNFKVKLGVNIPLNNNENAFKKSKIGNVTVVINNSNYPDTIRLSNINFILNNYPIRPEVIERMIFLNSGDWYSNENVNATYNKLQDLQLFQKITISPTERIDSVFNYIDFSIHLQSGLKYDFTIEPQAITTDQNNTLGSSASNRNFGLAVNTQLNIRNVLNGAEQLQLRVRNALEAQKGFSQNNNAFFNSSEQSITATLSFPRLVGLKNFERKLQSFSSRSVLASSFIYESNLQYIRNVITAGLSYQINKKLYTFSFAPFEASYIKTSFADAELEAKSKNDILLQNIFANNLITDSRFGFIYSDKPYSKDGSYFYLKWDVIEIAGNIMSLLNQFSDKGKINDNNLFGVKFYQYAKSLIDLRYNQTLDINNSFHYHLTCGYALPYGNTPDFVPFEKRFFIGGSNSIRAFRPRALGPGAYSDINQIDHSGEVKFEVNYEYRFNIYKHFIEGAVFTDAGNIWLAKKDINRPSAEFNFDNLITQLAIGSGFGMRFNMNFFIFRLDAALPIRDPRYFTNNGWVIRTFIEKNQIWDNTILNFGVGYPF